jgi:hypothetical protein
MTMVKNKGNRTKRRGMGVPFGTKQNMVARSEHIIPGMKSNRDPFLITSAKLVANLPTGEAKHIATLKFTEAGWADTYTVITKVEKELTTHRLVPSREFGWENDFYLTAERDGDRKWYISYEDHQESLAMIELV